MKQPNVLYRPQFTASNGANIRPMVGKKFSVSEQKDLAAWLASEGFHVSGISENSIHIISSGRIEVPSRPLTEKEIARDAKYAAEAADRASRVKADETLVAAASANQWIEKIFGDVIGTYNRARLIEYLEGKKKKFEGLMNHRWLDGLKTLGADTSKSTDEILQHVKSSFMKGACNA